jgi:hypothetical protein
MKWEYKIIDLKRIHSERWETFLNELGQQGWRVKEIQFDPSWLAVMEREIPEPLDDEATSGDFAQTL